MTFNKTIQMCIFDGNPNGRIMCELSNWNGRVYKISRNDLSEFANRPDCDYTGVYFLFGKDEDNKDTVYDKIIIVLANKDIKNLCVLQGGIDVIQLEEKSLLL